MHMRTTPQVVPESIPLRRGRKYNMCKKPCQENLPGKAARDLTLRTSDLGADADGRVGRACQQHVAARQVLPPNMASLLSFTHRRALLDSRLFFGEGLRTGAPVPRATTSNSYELSIHRFQGYFPSKYPNIQ